MTRIVAIHPHLDLYGSDRMFVVTVHSLTTLGDLQVVVIPGAMVIPGLRGEGIEIAEAVFPVLRRADGTGRHFISMAMQIVKHIMEVKATLHRNDVVYINTITAPSWVVGARLARSAIITHVREGELDWPLWKSRLILAPLNASEVIIANSESTKQWVCRSWPKLESRTIVVYNGVANVPEESGVCPSPSSPGVRLLIIGRVAPRKGHDVAIRALAKLRARSIDAVLTVVGDEFRGSDEYTHALTKLAQELQVLDAIHFVGSQPDVNPWIREATLVLVPSRIEPFGTVAVEAMLNGRCAVVSAVGGLQEIVKHGETGLIVKPDDEDALADACLRLIEDPDFRHRMELEARSDALMRFGIERYRADLRDIVRARAAAHAQPSQQSDRSVTRE
jgi:hypothetical protein